MWLGAYLPEHCHVCLLLSLRSGNQDESEHPGGGNIGRLIHYADCLPLPPMELAWGVFGSSETRKSFGVIKNGRYMAGSQSCVFVDSLGRDFSNAGCLSEPTSHELRKGATYHSASME